MSLNSFLTPGDISTLFAKEITAAGGTVTETLLVGDKLFLRSTLPAVREVRAGDKLQAGVALRATDREVRVHPYVFRQVCRNGAIVAHALQSRHVRADALANREEADAAVSEAVRVCCEDEAFTEASGDMNAARDKVADVTLNLLPVLSRLRPELGTQIFSMIVERFFDGEDASRYGLMNAVTSVARDTADPEVRWDLEELGGGIPVGRPPAPELDDLATEPVAAG
jgi:hypothetical protein